MNFLKVIAIAGGLAAAALGLSQGAAATPLASAGRNAAPAEAGLVTKAYHWGRPHFVERRVYRPGRPIYRGYAPRPRLVCRTRLRVVRTPYGLVRRPTEVCTRRF